MTVLLHLRMDSLSHSIHFKQYGALFRIFLIVQVLHKNWYHQDFMLSNASVLGKSRSLKNENKKRFT